MNNLEIGNPSGFAGPPSMRIGRIALALDPSQISSQLVVIKTLAIEGAEVAIIAKGTDTNVQTLMKNLEAGDSAPAESESEAAAMKMIIDTFSFTNAKATLSSDLVGEKTVTIPDIQLTGIGRESSGVTAQQAAKQLLNPILKAATDAAVREGLGVDDLKKSATEKLNESVGEGLKSLTDLVYVLNGFFHRNFQVFEVDWLGDEIESSPIHGRPDIIHISICRDDDRFEQRVFFRQLLQKSQPVHFGHIDIAQHNINIGMLLQSFKCFIAVHSKYELVFLLSDLFAEFLLDQDFQICFIVDNKELGHDAKFMIFSFKTLKSTGLVTKSSAPSSIALE